jgi:peptidoglycan/LPS O-acetylase OafA/YrhL
VVAGRGCGVEWTRARPLAWVGLVSYGVYLWHYAVIQKASQNAGILDALGTSPGERFAVLVAIGLAGAVAIASVSYYVVERPFLLLKRRVRAEPGRSEPSEAIAEPAPVAPVTVR